MNSESHPHQLPPVHLSDVILFFRRNSKLLIVSSCIMAITALAFSFTQTKIYTATTTLLPEYSSAKSSIFSMAMSGANAEVGNLTPEVYPRILESTEFGVFLLQKEVTTSKHGVITLRDYLLDKPEASLFGKFLGLFRFSTDKEEMPLQKVEFKNNVQYYTPNELSLIKTAMRLVSASIEQKSNLIAIEASLPDPILAASLVEYAKQYLIDYIEDFRTTKVKREYLFLEERTKEAKEELNKTEYALQSYRDRNLDSYLNVSRIQEQRLNAQYTLNQSVYNGLVNRLEQAKIKMKEDKPVFKVLEPAIVPLSKSKPSRKLFFIGGAVLGFLGALIYSIFYREKLHLRIGL